MPDAERKHCVVIYALPQRQYCWEVELPRDATIGQAIDQARQHATDDVGIVPWDSADVGIFGELRSRTDVPRDGDRVELYRPLQHDPKESRRDRVNRLRGDARRPPRR
jgi:putative ubiquitin-RnfH superfamily antitoxin RatB of RatAB toxin-antitoxin module